MNVRRFVLSLLLPSVAFAMLGWGAQGTQQIAAQEYEVFDVRDWDPTEEDWDYSSMMVLESPETGDFYQDVNGNFVYQNNDSSQSTDQMRVLMSAHNIVAEVTVLIDKLTGTLSYKYSGEVDHTDTENDNNGSSGTGHGGTQVGGTVVLSTDPEKGDVVAEVVGLPGTNAPIPEGGTIHVFVTDKTVMFDAFNVWWDITGSSVFHKGVGDWDDVSDGFDGVDKDSVDVVVLSGHGTGGGVQSSGGGLVPWQLTPDHIKDIKDHTTKDSVIVICACEQGTGIATTSNIQKLADKLDRPVIVNTGTVNSGTHGNGTWLQFDPRRPPVDR